MTIGELLVEINGDNSGLKKSLSDSQKAFGSINDVAKDFIRQIGMVAIAWKAVDLAIQGINYNKAAEQAEIAFGVFLGSAEAAKDMIEEMRDLAKETPLEFADVRDAGLKLQAFGVAANKVVPSMRMLADVSAGLQIPIKDLAYLFGSVQAQGKAMTVDLMQFANRGIPIWTELAKVTGVQGVELKKMVEEGKIGFPQIEQAFNNMTSEGGKFFQMAVKQMDSLAGSQSNLNDNFDVFLGHITEGATGPLKEWNKGWAEFFGMIVTIDKEYSKFVSTTNEWAEVLFGVKADSSKILEYWGGVAKQFRITGTEQAVFAKTAEEIAVKYTDIHKKNNNDIYKTVQDIKAQYSLTGAEVAAILQKTRGVDEASRKILTADIDRVIQLKAQNKASEEGNDLVTRSLRIAETQASKEEEKKKRTNEYIALQKTLETEIAKINSKVAIGNIDEKKALEDKIKLRNDYKESLLEMLAKETISQKTFNVEVAKINSLNNANLESLTKIKEEDSAITMGKKLMADAQDEVNEKTLELLASEEAWFESDESILALRALMADETDVISKATMDALNATEDWFKETVKVEDILADVKNSLGLASKTFGSLAASARKFNNGPLADLLDGMAEAAKHGEEFADNLGALVASGGTNIGAWLGTITSGIALIADAWDALFGAQDDNDEKRKQVERERREAVKELEAEYQAHFVNELDRLEQERAERVAYARSIGADVLNIERYYAGEISKVRTKSSGTQVEESVIAAESAAIVARYNAQIAPLQNLIKQFNQLKDIAAATGGGLDNKAIDKYIAELTAQIATFGTQLSAELETVEARLIVFQDRYSEAFDGISGALTDALVSSSTEEEFTTAIMEMLRKMAIDAAILAAGFSEKFKEIGVMIAEALRDGFQEGEVTSIKAAISQLYTDATASIADINSLFPGFAAGTNFAPGGLALVGEQGPELMNVPRGSQIIPNEQTQALLEGAGTTYSKGDTVINIQSNAPLDPLETARQVQYVQESLAFAGAF